MSCSLQSVHNDAVDNAYDVVTVYGNKDNLPWRDDSAPVLLGNELRHCNFGGLTLKFVPAPPGGVGRTAESRHMFTLWGDIGGEGALVNTPDSITVTETMVLCVKVRAAFTERTARTSAGLKAKSA